MPVLQGILYKMIEQQRLAYLSALGIENYSPRRKLVGSLDSRQLVALEEQSMELSQNLLESEGTSNLDNKPADVDDFLIPPDVPTPVEATPESPDNKKHDVKESSIVRFTLSVWLIEKKLLIIDSRMPGEALPTDRLLQNILWRVGFKLPQLPSMDILRWPLFKGNQSSNDAQEAQAMVQAYINVQCQYDSLEQIWLMGNDARQFSIGDIDSDLSSTFKEGVKILSVPSLAELLKSPLKKAILWKALQ